MGEVVGPVVYHGAAPQTFPSYVDPITHQVYRIIPKPGGAGPNDTTLLKLPGIFSYPAAAVPDSGVTGASPVTPTPAPAPTITFSANTWGSTIPLIWGNIRCPGYYIWVLGIQSGTTVTLSTPYLSFAVAFGYPLLSETATVNRIWASSVLIYDATQTPSALIAGIAWTLYQGDDTQDPDPSIVADRGNVTPAFRGLRYMVFDSFPLSASGNAAPDISVEFSNNSASTGERVNLSDVYSAIAARAAIDIEVDDIADQIDGGLIAQDLTIAQFFRDQSIIYNFAIVDGDPIKLVRRPIGDALTIDLEVDVSELIQSSATDDVIAYQRMEQTQIPNQVQITYIEAAVDFQSSMQYARRPFFPIRQTISSAVQRFTVPFVQHATETLTLCYDTLYRAWTQQLGITVVLDALHLDIEAGDVVQLTTGEGTFVVRIVESDLNPANWTNQISGQTLLQRSGVSANADAGQLPNIITALPYPNCTYGQESFGCDVTPVLSNGRIWTAGNDFMVDGDDWLIVGGDPSIPSTVSRRFCHVVTADLSQAVCLSGLVADGTYLYLHIGFGDPLLYRIHQVTGAVDTLDMTAVLTDATSTNVRQQLISDGFLYLVAERTADSLGSTFATPPTNPGLFVARIDLSLFTQDSTCIKVLFITGTDSPPGGALHNQWLALGACIAGGKLLISAAVEITLADANHSTLYSVDLSDFSTITSVPVASSSDTAHCLGPGVSDGTFAYFVPSSITAAAVPQIHGARVDPSLSTGAITFFAITDDPFVTGPAQDTIPWLDDTYLYFFCNFPFGGRPPPLSQYIARRKLSDLSVPVVPSGDPAGFDLHGWLNANGIDAADAYSFSGAVTDGLFHYIFGYRFPTRTGSIIKISQDLTQAANFIAAGCIPPPRNDDFVNAVPISLGRQLIGTNIGATREVGEPEPTVPTGDDPLTDNSVWFNFTAPSTATFTVTIDSSKSLSIRGNSLSTLLDVYTGDAVDDLTHVASGAFVSNTVSFSGTVGVRYRIQVSGYDYDIGTIAITVT